jgi:hypothetical protein
MDPNPAKIMIETLAKEDARRGIQRLAAGTKYFVDDRRDCVRSSLTA